MATQQDLSVFVRHGEGGVAGMELAVEGIRCAGCMHAIESGLGRDAAILKARVNLALKRVTVEWTEGALRPEGVIEKLAALGFKAYPFLPSAERDSVTLEERRLLRYLAVAGFAAMNIMLLSVSVWSGANGDISPVTRDFFHWLSALIALPTAAYAGRPFFESALRALRAGAVNMDVPITLGIVLALGMSVVETANHSEHAYFDGAIMLIFFLLIGRYLDQMMRRRTRDLAGNLAALKAESATRLMPDGTMTTLPIAAIAPGDLVLVQPGERVCVDGIVESGHSEIDRSLVTGETDPAPIVPGVQVYAGTMNLTGALSVRVQAAGTGTLLDEIDKLMAQAVESRSRYVRLSDRAARLYAPLVHATALATLVGWIVFGLAWQQALIIAITVLIITCPCALGLAIPAVQVVAASALFRRQIMLKEGDALERLAEADMVVFDKTGTLTLPEPDLLNAETIDPETLRAAAALATASRHPLAQAISRAAGSPAPCRETQEHRGLGLSAIVDGTEMRLGSAEFCEAQALTEQVGGSFPTASLIAWRHGEACAVFAVGQRLRPDAQSSIGALRRLGLEVMILSGDRETAVAAVARDLGIATWQSGLRPDQKLHVLDDLAKRGRKVLMVGDGLNDAPALAKAHVSISPISATHLAQAAADIVFLGDSLSPVASAITIARKARALMVENLWFAVLYNAVAVPIAVAGLATPLVAAAAMSGSSLVVTLNALRAARRPTSALHKAAS
ncbi:heavy metal translocating P-type ATPase [Bosea sp. (in: a-proteobacteria)]|uniref:heavy metal translocating P-type ATPase n=1 Tax=Bosea sp. (in: a-proteobacteria) TaxID=1871050 RepID=UPI0027370B31|nr:heavy metal translocating P-type ATPase [Bosea sp. (in: a-proteobacteria)]MDP3407710.1 heavy metal translocating P-type ATPase [Bosea sp. (in: a-proteobacteria)]